jgi:hypothetical protein
MERPKPNAAPSFPVQPSAPQPEIVKTFTLPSGKVVTVLRAKGKHQRLALMAAGPTADRYKILYALIAQITRIDGKIVPMEALDEMDLSDLILIEKEVNEVMGPLGAAKEEVEKEHLPS